MYSINDPGVHADALGIFARTDGDDGDAVGCARAPNACSGSVFGARRASKASAGGRLAVYLEAASSALKTREEAEIGPLVGVALVPQPEQYPEERPFLTMQTWEERSV